VFTSFKGDGTALSDEGAGVASTSAAEVQEGAFLLLLLVFLMHPLFCMSILNIYRL
jgi:hypothetical protein